MEIEVALGLIVGTIGTVAACIAAFPIVIGWMPQELSDIEKQILNLSLDNDKYPGIIQYYVEPLGNKAKPHVNAPYSSNHVDVMFEVLDLREKGLIQVMDNISSGRENVLWYQLTVKGYKLAKKFKSQEP